MGEAGEASKPLPRIEIAVTDSGDCPVLVAGSSMVYAHPEVLKNESGRICAQSLGMLAPAAEEMARTAAAGRRIAPFELRCPVKDCGARFELRVKSSAEEEPVGKAPSGRPDGSAKAERDSAEPRRPVNGVVPTGPLDRRETEPVPAPSPASETHTVTRRIRAGVASAPFLSRLAPDIVREIAESSKVKRFPQHTVFICEGQEGEALYIVAEGDVEVVRSSGDGHEVVLAVVGKGHCLGEMSLVTGQPASATVRTRDESVAVLVLPRETFEELLNRHPTLHKEFSRIIAERLYDMNVKLENETSHGIAGRLAMIGVVDLVQTLHASRRTGTLTIHDGSGREAYVGFREGDVVSAVVDGEPGAAGFYSLLPWQEGDFSFEGGEPQPDPAGEGGASRAAVTAGTMALLMEGLRRLDEKGS